MKLSLLLMSLLAPVALHATTVYSNDTTDTGGTIFYSTGPYVQIGDQISLAGTERAANFANASYFNGGTAGGTFDATLRFFNVGSPVGSQIGGTFTNTVSITAGNVASNSWTLSGLVLPTNVIFTISLSNISTNLDIGLLLFQPPTIGSSSNQFFITSLNGTTYSQTSQGNSQDNVYFLLDASPVAVTPEPGTMLLTLLALPVFALARKRLR